uniref:winged helix-turn-helix transcriptional regulator n=1 Tax=uncultured Sphingomonas sp. TaxID=158754 RepID=UPI0035CBDDA8
MDTEQFIDGPCPIGRGLHRIGDSWSMLILRNAGAGQTRFDQFQKSLGIAPNILTRRLTALTREGLLERRRYSEKPPRDEYLLTTAGRDFLPVLYALGAWGARHFSDGAVTALADASSGAPVRPMVIDRNSGRRLAEMELRLEQPAAAPHDTAQIASSNR